MAPPVAAPDAGSSVTLSLPASVVAVDIGNKQYRVTFHWKPEHTPERPRIAGTFNRWDRSGKAMTGPDARGQYSVTLELPEGEYQYKYLSGNDEWHRDPLNPNVSQDGYGNSVLRLGRPAAFANVRASRGDGQILRAALEHRPEDYHFYEVLRDGRVLIRYRALHDDIQGVEFHFVYGSSGEAHSASRRMLFAGSDGAFDYYETRTSFPQPAPTFYRFTVHDGTTTFDDPSTFPLTLSSERRIDTPNWASHAIWYQIMIDRFRNGDPENDPEHTKGTGRVEHTSKWTGDYYTVQPWERDDDKGIFKADGNGSTTPDIYERLYGGDFQGVIDKLDYLKDLGVTAIYFNPVFEATSAHKYNAKSYLHADDGYGVPGEFVKSAAREDLLDPKTWEINRSDEMLLQLLKEAKARGFHVIIDGVFNHLGNDSIPFLDLKDKKQDSKFADWYDVESWDPLRASGWAGYGGLPQFRKDATGFASKSLHDHILAVTRRWLDPDGDGDPSDGVDGWRLDVPNEIPKPFWQEWRRFVKSVNPEAYIVGEIWDPAEEWLDGTTFDAVMNYQFRVICLKYFGNQKKRISAAEFDAELARLRLRYPAACNHVLQNLFDSHDTDRVASRMMNPDMDGDPRYDGGNRKQDNGPNYDDSQPTDEAYRRVALMALFQATYVGAPMIIYGDEVGMYGADDPICRMPMWWQNLMPYDNPDYVIRGELREAYKALFHLRNSHEALQTGDYRTLVADDARDVFAFARYFPEGGEKIIVVLNNSKNVQKIQITSPAGGDLPILFSDIECLYGDAKALENPEGDSVTLVFPGVSGLVFRVGG